MKSINLPSGNYIFVEIPDDALNNRWFVVYNEVEKTFKIEFQTNTIDKYISLNTIKDCYIVTTTNDITEEQCQSIVESHIYKYADKQGNDFTAYLDYEYSDEHPEEALFDYMTAKQSLQSLLKSLELDLELNYLILKKDA